MHRLIAALFLVASIGFSADGDDFGFPLDDPEPVVKQAADVAAAADEDDDFFPLDDEEDRAPPAQVDFQKVLQGVLQEALQDAFPELDKDNAAADGDDFLDEFDDDDEDKGDDFLDQFDDGGEAAAPVAQNRDAQVEAVIEGIGALIGEALKEQGGEAGIGVDVELEGALKNLQINVNKGEARPEDDDFAIDGGLDAEPKFVQRPVKERYAEAAAAVFADVKVEAETGLWYVDGKGVLRLIERETAMKRKVPSPGALFAIEDLKIAHLLPLEGELWAGTNHGLFLFKFSNWSWTRIAVNLLETDVAINSLIKEDEFLVVRFSDPEEEGRFDIVDRRWIQHGKDEAAVPAVPPEPEEADSKTAAAEAAVVAPAVAAEPVADRSLPLFVIVGLVAGLVVIAIAVTMLMGRRDEV